MLGPLSFLSHRASRSHVLLQFPRSARIRPPLHPHSCSTSKARFEPVCQFPRCQAVPKRFYSPHRYSVNPRKQAFFAFYRCGLRSPPTCMELFTPLSIAFEQSVLYECLQDDSPPSFPFSPQRGRCARTKEYPGLSPFPWPFVFFTLLSVNQSFSIVFAKHFPRP